jgi:hypothetical protein
MTVSSTTTKNSYSGNGSTTTFAYGFKIFANTDLTVILRAATGAETVQTLTTHYTVTNVGVDTGGNVVFGSAPASGVTVVIRRNMALTQSTDYVANDPFPAATHEDALDRLTFISQQMQEESDRSIKLSRTNTMTSTEFTTSATDRANKVLSFDGNGELSVTQELGTYKGTDATVTTEAYVIRDIIKSTTAAQLNNVYICVADAVIGDSLTDTDHFELLVDAVSAATSATNAANSASAASTSESNAATSASTATTQASNASTSASTASTQATNAANSATAASNAQAAAEAALDTFDDRFLGAKASDPTVDNDGNALLDGALYFDTTNDIMKVYDLTNTTWRQLTLTSTNQTNVNTVAGQISPTNNIATVAGADSNITAVAGSIANVNTAASNIANINSVAGNESNINSAVSNESNINAVVSNASNINSVAGNATNINSVAGSITNVNTVATNLASVNNFADVYRINSSAPTTSLDVGDLYFDTTSDILKVYGASGWQSAGSSVNGTSQRYHYDIGGAVTSVTGSDANGNTLAYDAGYVDVYVNGVRMSTADVTVTSGDTVTFAEALASGDEVDIVGYGTFAVASLNADNLDSGTVPTARVAGSYTGVTGTGALNAGSITSGFGAIDNGASAITTTGAISGGTLGLTGALTANGGAVFNEGGADVDFRVESDTLTHALFVNGADGNVGIGTASAIRSGVLSVNGIISTDANIYFGAAGNGRFYSDINWGLIFTADRASPASAEFMWENAGGTERMRINSSGNVGIGTSSPANTLAISKSTTSTDGSVYPSIKIENTSAGSGNSYANFVLNGGNGTTQFSMLADGRSSNSAVYIRTDTATPLLFLTNGSERMRIDSSGNVGIGISDPSQAKLMVQTQRSTAFNASSLATWADIVVKNQLDTTGIATGIAFVPDGQGYDNGASGIAAIATANDSESHLVFITRGNGAASSEKMRITSAGKLLIGNTSADAMINITNTYPNTAIRTNSNNTTTHWHLEFHNANGRVGNITTDGGVTQFNTSSDYRLKENVVTEWDATTRLKQLKPSRFNFIADADTTVDGFLAHEVQEIVPEAISGTKDGLEVWREGEELPDGVSVGNNKLDDDGNTIPLMQGIDQSKLVPLLVKTIQELEARITALEGA